MKAQVNTGGVKSLQRANVDSSGTLGWQFLLRPQVSGSCYSLRRCVWGYIYIYCPLASVVIPCLGFHIPTWPKFVFQNIKISLDTVLLSPDCAIQLFSGTWHVELSVFHNLIRNNRGK